MNDKIEKHRPVKRVKNAYRSYIKANGKLSLKAWAKKFGPAEGLEDDIAAWLKGKKIAQQCLQRKRGPYVKKRKAKMGKLKKA